MNRLSPVPATLLGTFLLVAMTALVGGTPPAAGQDTPEPAPCGPVAPYLDNLYDILPDGSLGFPVGTLTGPTETNSFDVAPAALPADPASSAAAAAAGWATSGLEPNALASGIDAAVYGDVGIAGERMRAWLFLMDCVEGRAAIEGAETIEQGMVVIVSTTGEVLLSKLGPGDFPLR